MNIIAVLRALGDKAERAAFRAAPLRAFLLFIFRPVELVTRHFLYAALKDIYGHIPPEVSQIVEPLVMLRCRDNAEDAMRLASLFEIYASTLECLPQDYFVESGNEPPDPLAFLQFTDQSRRGVALLDRAAGNFNALANLRPEVRAGLACVLS